ncbi:long-chain-fatty-acid--CoA ligase [Sphingomonas sp.]|jgi:acyl-CoA synthetase (AMP-forming)/AMP-acid ligase II|uniref:long-chain-fatty-acid--CoA ligase n=1 Tax=Sphingomonas sp. TaxID=28214 RepID=UPI002621FD22|nr:long-chain-fatty-acid--CoA ligase [Sphingomonas sp.]MDF2495264.1 putative long-chain-fatty-acid--CoA ligase [Sphingomonas sp.]
MTNLPPTFGEALARHAAERPQQVALRFEDRVTDYAPFDAHVSQIANGLLAMGLNHGDRVAYVGKNSDWAVELALGTARAGMVLVPIIWRLAPAEVDGILADSGSQLLFVEPAFSRDFAVGQVVVMDDGFARWRDAQSPVAPAVTVTEHDVVLQLYTSGTTGAPKGVMLSHANGIRQRQKQIDARIDWLLADPGDTTIIAMPYGHIGGVGVALGAVNSGQELIIHAEYDAANVMDAIAEHRVRRLFLVPAAIGLMLQHSKAATADFSSIETLSYGASPIPLPLLQQAVQRIGCGFVQVYGMTETWGSIVALPPEDHLPGREDKMTAAGKALPGVELKIIDEDGNTLPPGEIGEVAIRSSNNTRGYWNKPEESAKALIGDGWLRTGDAGILDEHGYLFIQDRIKDMIITGAENVYPAEVESAIYGHPAVADVAVIGVPDPKWGEAVKAIVVLKPGADCDPAAIITHARERIAGFKCPKSVDFIEALPRNPSGKILRRTLREPFWAGHERRVN